MPTDPRATRLKTLFNISPEEYDGLLAAQGGCCAICHSPPKKNRLSVDHRHKTGLTRGLLCMGCNSALAKFRDDVDRLFAAGHYLLVPPATEYFKAPRYGCKGRVTNKASTRKWLNRQKA